MLVVMKCVVKLDMVVVVYCEENMFINKGCVYEGKFFEKYGLNGILLVCEFVYIVRDILFVEVVDCYYYVCYVSMKGFVCVICDVKCVGIKVIVEVILYYLVLCEDDILLVDFNFKMNLLFCGKEDYVVLIEGLLDGMIDMIVIDYVLYIVEEKV